MQVRRAGRCFDDTVWPIMFTWHLDFAVFVTMESEQEETAIKQLRSCLCCSTYVCQVTTALRQAVQGHTHYNARRSNPVTATNLSSYGSTLSCFTHFWQCLAPLMHKMPLHLTESGAGQSLIDHT